MSCIDEKLIYCKFFIKNTSFNNSGSMLKKYKFDYASATISLVCLWSIRRQQGTLRKSFSYDLVLRVVSSVQEMFLSAEMAYMLPLLLLS